MGKTLGPEQQAEPEQKDNGRADAVAPAAARSAAEAAQVLERTLAHFETMLAALEERARHTPEGGAAQPQQPPALQRDQGETFRRLEEALGRLSAAAERLSDEASGLAHVAGGLEERIQELAGSFGGAEPPYIAEPIPEPEPAAPQEPVFQSNGGAIGIALAAVPGFQGLMDVQRALSNLPQSEAASVVAYKNGEASLEVTLRDPLSASQIVETLGGATGHQLLIEESRPEELRLRLRFVE